MQRILVSGVAGAGKTTTAALLAARLDLPRRELDALHHGPGWVKRPEFEAEVAAFTAGSRWVTDCSGIAPTRWCSWTCRARR